MGLTENQNTVQICKLCNYCKVIRGNINEEDAEEKQKTKTKSLLLSVQVSGNLTIGTKHWRQN